MRANKLFKKIPLEVQGMVFLADLMELSFGKFDLILGMDWLVKHQENLDYVVERVVLKIVEGDEGCEVYLAYVSASGSVVTSVKDIRIVKDFLDVFPDELPRLPLNREVEFGIELLPGRAPVSITPYRMAPKELLQLKAQIQGIEDEHDAHLRVTLKILRER
ncbi:uncharacterized protein [Gossypium hirsutum]|uniref:RVP_2 domain-containing protein n=1 Tax=Gossypium hirsutum TaxID=3635 RepID=A0A1U8N2F6_GOSHI|nr:uncharacterized protein LOC107943969 [Gossypium hirsutum]